MARRKKHSGADQEPFAPIPTANIPRDPATLAKLGEGLIDAFAAHERETAEREAKAAIAEAGRRPKRRTPRDIGAVNRRLRDVAHTLAAIHRMSILAIDYELQDRQDLLLLIRESARSSARAVDVCMQRLGEDLPIGCFADELGPD
jgi:hypothetical protein